MKKTLFNLLLSLFTFFVTNVAAQNQVDFDFGEIKASDFELPDSPFLRGAAAVYLADVGNSEYVTHSTGKFTVEYKRHVRIKIVNKNGFDAANFSIPLYNKPRYSETVTELKAVTYNLENGAVIQSELQEDQVFIDKKNKRFSVKKFAMPSVREGSIIDVQYAVSSDFLGEITTWYFQGEYPRIRTEYNLLLPVDFDFSIVKEANYPFTTDTTITIPFSYSDVQNMGYAKERSRFTYKKWVMKNVPGLKLEPFTTSLKNHWTRIGFYVNYFGDVEEQGSYAIWSRITGRLLQSEYFGALLYEKNNWLNEVLKPVLAGASDPMDKARKIYAYVRDNFTCTDPYELFLAEPDLKKVLHDKKGTAADLNLLLIAMLYHAGIESSPVILSTVQNGKTNQFNPVLEKYNKTVVICLVNNKVYYLDASDRMLAFGKLNSNCYNGYGRIIRGNSLGVNLAADSIKEKKASKLLITNDVNGKWQGKFTSTLGYYQSLELRKTINEKGIDAVVKNMQLQNDGISMSKPVFEAIENKDEPIKISFDVEGIKEDDNSTIYLNPVIGEIYADNPFKSEQRLYPVEMSYTFEESYDSEIAIPGGYIVDGMPGTYQVLLNGGDGLFEYLIDKKQDKIVVHSRVVLHKANFPAEAYKDLRDFFADIVKKHNEQIVFKKLNK